MVILTLDGFLVREPMGWRSIALNRRTLWVASTERNTDKQTIHYMKVSQYEQSEVHHSSGVTGFPLHDWWFPVKPPLFAVQQKEKQSSQL